MINIHSLVLFLSLVCILSSSGGYDHGTSTGKGKFELDLTLNPFNYFENGQSYAVIGYGLSDKIDLHGYYADHGNYENGVDSYYFGIFYQFYDSKLIDLATAIGRRKMKNLDYGHFFFPQLLYNVKINNNYTIGGSLVRVQKDSEKLFYNSDTDWYAYEIALFSPITKYFEKYKYIESVKFGIGLFKTGLTSLRDNKKFMPTYSIDFKFKRIQRFK